MAPKKVNRPPPLTQGPAFLTHLHTLRYRALQIQKYETLASNGGAAIE